jgi:hypothetical protein
VGFAPLGAAEFQTRPGAEAASSAAKHAKTPM